MSRWDLNEGSGEIINDSSGFGCNGTLTGAVFSTNTPYSVLGDGAGKYSLSFDGSTYATIEYKPILDSPASTNKFTVETWVYQNSLDTNKAILERGDKLRIYTVTGRHFHLMTRFVEDAGGTGLDSSFVYDMGKWYHVAGSYDGAAMRIYINGVLDGSLIVNKTLASNNSSGIFLGKSVVAGREFNGLIDDVRIYNNSLTAFEIQQHYAEGLSRHSICLNE
jgi:hypothetical protein